MKKMTEHGLETFQKKKEYLFCIDSDGCAMDTMDVKHIRIFGPCMVEEWELFSEKEWILNRWNELNLYSMTRGMNRFKGLAKMLREVHEKYGGIEGLDEFERWTWETSELSEKALEKSLDEMENKGVGKADCDVRCVCMRRALEWSREVNERIRQLLPGEKKPFENVKEALAYANQIGDVVVVSSANKEAVLEEWEQNALLNHVDLILTQNVGNKEFCIHKLLAKGYENDNVIMVGDAPGDMEAAKKNDVFFYPILVRSEISSWEEFCVKAIPKLMDASYGIDYAQKKEKQFLDNLQAGTKQL